MQKRFFMDHPTQISSNYEHRIGYLEEIVGLLLAKQGHHTVSCTVSTAQPTSSFRYSIDRGLIPLLSKTTKESLTYGRNAKSKETRSSHYSDRSFGIHHRPSIISVDSFNRSFSSLNCSTGSKPRLNSLLSGAINTQPPPPATPTSVNYSNLGSLATGPNHLLISTPDLMTCDSPPFFPASATLEPRPSLADRLSSKGKKNPPFQLHSPDQLPFSSRPVSPRTKNILDGIGIENHNSRIDIENDLEITTGFGPCPRPKPHHLVYGHLG
ncbi:hypothetical protein KEM48_004209 [Puccinia striiformis f. sp. tritici PST-130]|nr:hypothetical protein KEM48_004209 [Puccinia striiformis f. sp. tritici PST-130]